MGEDDTGTTACFGFTDWEWLNPPAHWTASQDALDVTAGPDSDFWVRTHYGFVRDTGHALLRPVPARFRLCVTFDGEYRDQYDQAGLLLRLDDRNWIKAGVEYVDGLRQISAVVTRDVSDWSVAPVPAADATGALTVELYRDGDTVTVTYGTGGVPETLLRLAWFPVGGSALAGPMCAAPDGRGFTARFTAMRFGES